MNLTDMTELVALLLGSFGFGLAVGMKIQIVVLFFKQST